MISITKIFEFAAAHRLPYHQGLCQNLHGHNYKLEVEIAGGLQTNGPGTGMVMDFSDLKKIVNQACLKIVDHSNLNNLYSNPTAEEMVQSIAISIQITINQKIEYNAPPTVTRIRLWETSTSYAEWRK